jgi:hypothetical protein
MTTLDTLNAGLDLSREWMLIDPDGLIYGFWNSRPVNAEVRALIEDQDEHGPYYLVEAFKRETWDYSRSAREAYEIDMTVPPAPATAPVQSGPRKVVIR